MTRPAGSRKDRLAALIAALSLPTPQTLATLARRLLQPQRTLARDLTDLIAAGYPIEGEPGEGYRLVRLMQLPALTLTEAALDQLQVALAQLDGPDAAHLRLLLAQAVGVFLDGQDLDHLTHDIPTRTMSASARHLPRLRRAIHRMQPVSLRYRDAQDQVTDRTVQPLGLERWGVAWALVAWCDLRRDFRTFRLDRILSCTVHPDPRPPGLGRDLATFQALHRDRD